MTRWPFYLAEIALYTVLSGLLIAMVLDARDRWREARDPQNRAGAGGADGVEDEEAATSGVHPPCGDPPDDPEPPPLAS